MKDATFNLDSALTEIARLGLMAHIEQGLPLIAGLKVIEAVESIASEGIVDIDGPTSAQVIDSRYELEAALLRGASSSIDALRAAEYSLLWGPSVVCAGATELIIG
jgi:hypothetical protein